MTELVVISGKGGTGKTSIAASLVALSGSCVSADCDVDAADLNLVLSPEILDWHSFYSGHTAVIRQEDCTGCAACRAYCRFDAITGVGRHLTVDPVACEGCGVCVEFCPAQAIDFPERLCGEWFVSETRYGPLLHARLAIAQSNSGKLVSLVRRKARVFAEQRRLGLIIVDGSPGIGCPVIASVTGASLVLVVTEPTPSGEHDLGRVVQLTRCFAVPLAVCINKWDLNVETAERITAFCRDNAIPLVGRVHYDRAFTKAQIQGRTIVETSPGGATEDIRGLWHAVRTMLDGSSPQEITRHAARAAI